MAYILGGRRIQLRRVHSMRMVPMRLNPIRAAWVSSSFLFASVSAVVILTGSVCLAQVTGGTISGSVRDSSGQAIVRAQVAVKNYQMAILRSSDADNNGIYT